MKKLLPERPVPMRFDKYENLKNDCPDVGKWHSNPILLLNVPKFDVPDIKYLSLQREVRGSCERGKSTLISSSQQLETLQMGYNRTR
jgi:hypothetical protein